MGSQLTSLLISFCVVLCCFEVHGSPGHAADGALSLTDTPEFHVGRLRYLFRAALEAHGSRWSGLVASVPSDTPIQSTARTGSKSIKVSLEDSYHKHHHHHQHHHHRHHEHHDHSRNQYGKSAASPSYLLPPMPHASEAARPSYAVSPVQPPYSSTPSQSFPVLAPSPSVFTVSIRPPSLSPSSTVVELTPPPASAWALPPPPPNEDCTSLICTEPLTTTPSGFPCGCVWPIQVKLQLNVALYTFFPLISKLAAVIASSLALNQSQVRIMGANAANQQPEKTIVLVYLVPPEGKFGRVAAFSAYQKFWHKQIHVNASLFGAYDVLDVHYPGLPPSPPSVSSNLATIDDHSNPASVNNKGKGGNFPKPLGVDVPRRKKNRFNGNVAAVIIVSCITAIVTCAAVAWILMVTRRCSARHSAEALHTPVSSFTKPSGAARSLAIGSKSLSESMSCSSGMLNFTGSAKIFSLHEMDKATDGFDASRILGEGGFGVVYRGIFDDGEQVAVKVLKRDNRHGVREFLSEVEMLSRLHHRNLVKLLGICTEDQIRCLVYELVPNGSVDSHLHGVDKEIASLDWPTRMKIALGAARGLAYLHEDSSPCVIHRDFKSSNILLEHDFTPKVSDFGLATNAWNGANQPISTHVIGTFGYLAPEYAMTGHLLVKSDVYSYGVVLLELLTGRKPVDFSKPQGQENLVAWAQPLLTNKEGLEKLMDATLGPSVSFDSFSKVAAIASMCIQPEVSCRPFMGEVVQALKLVCSEFDDVNEEGPRISFNQEKISLGEDSKRRKFSTEFQEFLETRYPVTSYESSSDARIALSAVDLVSASAQLEQSEFESLRRPCSSGTLGLGRKIPLWRRFSRGSMRERLWPGNRQENQS